MANQLELFDVGQRDVHGLGSLERRTCTPALIGSGPAGETCGTCRFKTSQGNTAGRYLKCELVRKYWTRGAATDIKARWPACAKWEPQTEATPCPS